VLNHLLQQRYHCKLSFQERLLGLSLHFDLSTGKRLVLNEGMVERMHIAAQ
jgi:hypothetical protein